MRLGPLPTLFLLGTLHCALSTVWFQDTKQRLFLTEQWRLRCEAAAWGRETQDREELNPRSLSSLAA
jgi:hypothetical protein